MGYGFGRKWHKRYNFPNFPRVTKTLTFNRRIRYPFLVFKYKNSVWNKVSLHNIGFFEWFKRYSSKDLSNIIVSIAGTEDEINQMISILDCLDIMGIEINISCPNVFHYDKIINLTNSRHDLYLKIACDTDIYSYNFLDRIKEFRLNSVKMYGGGVSGKIAQEYNWSTIKYLIDQGFNAAGCSCLNFDDVQKLADIGCTNIGIGSTILIDPIFVESLRFSNIYDFGEKALSL